jgi:DNA-binding response OmpR family regulator
METMRVLVVEDEHLLANALSEALRGWGYEVEQTGSGVAADRALRFTDFDLVVLDIGLPDIDGFEVLRRLRVRGAAARVLVLSARDSVDDRVYGLNLGADDYLTKPFSIVEYGARVNALLRRTSPHSEALTIGKLEVNYRTRQVFADGQPVELTVREWALLEYFIARPGRVLSKDQIAERLVESDEAMSINSVEGHVSRLRAKIQPAGIHIHTVRGFGYLWDPDRV